MHSSGVLAFQSPHTLAFFVVVASALLSPTSPSRSMFSGLYPCQPATRQPARPPVLLPVLLPVWLPCLWISLAQSPGLLASSSSPPRPRPFSQLLPCLKRARSAPFRSFLGQFFFFTASLPCRDKEVGWGGRAESVVIFWKRQRLAP